MGGTPSAYAIFGIHPTKFTPTLSHIFTPQPRVLQFLVVVGAYAIQLSHLYIRRDTQNHPEEKAWWLGRDGDLLLAYVMSLATRLINRRDDVTIKRDETAQLVEPVRNDSRDKMIPQNFYSYNDFVFMSINKWLRIFIPCR